jgi:hypothetical protein
MSITSFISLYEVSTTNKDARKIQAVKIAVIINVSAFGKPGDPGTYKVLYDPRAGKVGEINFDDSRANNLKDVCQRYHPR